MSIDTYLVAHAAYKTASDRAYTARDRISKEKKIGLAEAQNDPEYKALAEESSRLYWEADALTAHPIRANLTQFGLADPMVVGTLRDRNGTAILGTTSPTPLAQLCALRYRGIAREIGLDPEKVGFSIEIATEGRAIGFVDSDGGFHHEAAPDLRTALAWKVATDGGRERLVTGFNPDQAAEDILAIIATGEPSEAKFFGSYSAALKKIFVYEESSRFSDGHCSAMTTLWHVATRELGCEHAGYGFAY